jgi:hypothetical protein
MALPSEAASSDLQATDGATVAWSFLFRIDSKSDAQLMLLDADGLELGPQDPSSWDISGLRQDDGGVVTWPRRGDAYPAGYKVRVDRRPAFTQQQRLTTQGEYDPEAVELRGLDPIVMQTQWLLAEQQRQLARLRRIEGVIDVLGPIPVFPKSPFLTAADLGLAGDGVTDDAPTLQLKADYWSVQGGAVFFLQAAGGVFRLDGKVRLGSGISVILASPLLLGADGGLALAGDIAGVAGRIAALAVDAASGDATLEIDSALAGGASVSALFPVGGQVTLTASPDSAGTPRQRHEARVTALDDGAGTITLTPALDADYPAGGLIRLQQTGYLLTDAALDTDAVTLVAGQAAGFLAGDYVLAEDDKRISDIGGTDATRVRRQPLRIEAITGDLVRFDRTLEIGLETSRHARVTLLDPCVDSSVQGATAVFAEAPAPAPAIGVRTFEIAYAVRCFLYDPAALNEDLFGSRGDAVRLLLSIDCAVFNPQVISPKYSAAGEGYGLIFDWCSDCYVDKGFFYACRHSVVFSSSARCVALTPISVGALLTDLEFHGAGERNCAVVDPKIIGGSRVATGAGSRAAINFGDTFHLGGSFKCRVSGGSVSHYRGDTAPTVHQAFGIVWQPGVGECEVLGTRFVDVEQAMQVLDIAAQPGLVARRCRAEIEVDGCASYLGWFVGNQNNPSAPYTIEGLELRVRARNIGKMFRFKRIKGLSLSLNLAGITPDAGEPYVFRAVDVPSLIMVRSLVKGPSRGVSLQGCTPASPATGDPFLIDANEWIDLGLTEVLDDLGGNDGGYWGSNPCFNFTPTMGGTLTSVLGFARSPGSYSLANNGVLALQPLHPRGRIFLSWATGAGYLHGSYGIVGGTPGFSLLSGSSGVAMGTGTPAGTGTADKLWVGADGILRFEHRSGGTLAVDVEIPA